jgi:hypothetical protein
MLKRAVRSSLTLLLAASVVLAPVEHAEARHGRGIFSGLAFGLIALAIIEASRHHRHHHRQIESHYDREPECEWRGRTCFDNSYGDHVCRRVHVQALARALNSSSSSWHLVGQHGYRYGTITVRELPTRRGHRGSGGTRP